MNNAIAHSTLLDALETIKDPEIPYLSIVDLGMVVSASEDEGNAKVVITPTFAACPAIDYIQKQIRDLLLSLNGIHTAQVTVSFEHPWNSDKISERGREILREMGFAPPPLHGGNLDMNTIGLAVCPRCGSHNTVMQNAFGPTLCRAIHYCNACRNTFEQFKPVD